MIRVPCKILRTSILEGHEPGSTDAVRPEGEPTWTPPLKSCLRDALGTPTCLVNRGGTSPARLRFRRCVGAKAVAEVRLDHHMSICKRGIHGDVGC
ncbi:hypothetical protein KC19_VG143400 [Ceratodon purpureus]|uniref:Uncharacterized protein n=1 Tax=Ceratodon purpureus TaxID=3225 RepID=A0A8T0HR60_CERPU|nr:hypothetical protein KC19_VG143400 [Ceratodon purpureus]